MAYPIRVAPGQTLEGRFLLLEEIGRGGMSTVFKAADLERAGALVAVKVPLPQFSSGLGSWSMFQREAEIGLSLCHPNIVGFVALAPGKRSYIATEYVEGVLLAARLGNGQKLCETEALRIVSRLCDAVHYLHGQGLVHYDVKPGNVLLRADGRVTLIDFGLAHRVLKGRFAFAASAPAIASADYAAPEQIGRVRGQTSVDIYALGAMLYEMLTGRAPFEGDDPFVVASARQLGDPTAPRVLEPGISVQVEEIILRALRRNPRERYASAVELKADLDDPARVHVSGLAERLVEVTPWRKRRRWLRFITKVAVLPIAIMLSSFRLLWWYLEHKP